jgi:soluble lytic murein transglycosylase
LFLKTLLLAALIISPLAANAVENTSLRKTFLEAEKKIWKADKAGFQQLYQQLHYYPLQPYLDQQNLIQNMNLSLAKDIDSFLNKYEGTPLDWPLRKKWLNYLVKNKQQSLFLYNYKSSSSATLSCAYLQYSLNKGVSEKVILPKVGKLWTVGKSQPDICDPVFKKWVKAGYRTEEIIWKRISLAADGGKHTLIPYLTKLLPKSKQYLGTLWHRVRRNPAYVIRKNAFKSYNKEEGQIFSYGIKRLIWRQPDKAIDTFTKLSKKFKFTSDEQQDITRAFALSLANKNHAKAQKWLHKVDDNYINSSVTQWRVADVLRKQDWNLILRELKTFPVAQQSSNQWKYWYSRGLIETNSKTEGLAILKELSKSRHYYGFLAASYLDVPYNLQNKPLTITNAERIKLLKSPSAKRAFELFHVGKYSHARSEWNYWMKQLSDQEKLAASVIATEQKWFDRAIFTLARVKYLNDVNLRFPLAFESHINKFAKKNKIDAAWVYAIARRESSFMSDANSGVGAKGLMQIMPATAKQLKRKSVSIKYLLNAKNNVELGTKYLKMLSDRYKGNHVLATASYNAGPHRVKKWAKEAVNMPIDMWVETIPYKETREYVKSVMAYQQIYQDTLGKTGTIFSDLIKNKL